MTKNTVPSPLWDRVSGPGVLQVPICLHRFLSILGSRFGRSLPCVPVTELRDLPCLAPPIGDAFGEDSVAGVGGLGGCRSGIFECRPQELSARCSQIGCGIRVHGVVGVFVRANWKGGVGAGLAFLVFLSCGSVAACELPTSHEGSVLASIWKHNSRAKLE